MRDLVGKDFQNKVLLKVTNNMKESNAKQEGTSSANLRLAVQQLGGSLQVENTIDDDEEDDAMGEVEDKPETLAGLNMVPRKIAERGTKNMKKYNIPIVKRTDGAISKRMSKRGSTLPGVGRRITKAQKPKKLVSF